MIYTCYEMVRDCRADRPEGWSYFLSHYVPVIRKLLAHYGDTTQLERVVVALGKPESGMFQPLEPAPERWFVAELRQKVLAEMESPAPEIEIELETVAAALEPLTLIEKQAAWFEALRYEPNETAVMLRMAPATVEKIRERSGELIRARVDRWRPALLAENGTRLGRAAAGGAGRECLTQKSFLEVLDGRATWRGREDTERHVTSCWHCIDHFCRMREVVELLRGIEPLPEEEAAAWRKLLGLRAEKQGGWKRFFGAA